MTIEEFELRTGIYPSAEMYDEIRWEYKNGIKGRTGRGNIGIQDNFR